MVASICLTFFFKMKVDNGCGNKQSRYGGGNARDRHG
jgi:hypothetical protein